ncbi:ParB/RepB/Spo0J family partition protein [uncultured Campylobacter sp.]|uniref:ParB/RepB/Spo0J family partition protein n=1 Tax=uncultured Campylobacter sp. TaxID=218934 RepID=UPI00261A98A8|nr:ParB/RepB/Spo0J family partition protein [uncultured Campylobacter sp.]
MAKVKKARLGRGLDAILGDVESAYARELESGNEDLVLEIPVEKVKPNPYQPRAVFDKEALEELAQSIKRHGLIQPIIVIKKDDDFQLIAGERRLRATKLLEQPTIKAIVADIESSSLRELALIENIQREDLNPLELAKSYKELIDEYKITQEELSNIIKKSRSQITNTLRILLLTEESKKALLENKISQGHAKVMVGLDSEDEIKILNTIIGQKLNVRQTEELIQKIKSKNSEKFKSPKKDDKNRDEFAKELGEFRDVLNKFGKIKINQNRLTIEFKDLSTIKDFKELFC